MLDTVEHTLVAVQVWDCQQQFGGEVLDYSIIDCSITPRFFPPPFRYPRRWICTAHNLYQHLVAYYTKTNQSHHISSKSVFLHLNQRAESRISPEFVAVCLNRSALGYMLVDMMGTTASFRTASMD
jgi:hypothetical protein